MRKLESMNKCCFCLFILKAGNFCYSNPCMNDGTCYENGDAFRCGCPALWGGPTCVNWLGPMTTTPDPITITGKVTYLLSSFFEMKTLTCYSFLFQR
jgi:hypothetical protein